MATVEVTRTYLELTAPSEFHGSGPPGREVRVERVEHPSPSLWRFLYTEVGRLYHWVDRQGWTDDEVRAYLTRPEISLWVMRQQETPAGYFELCQEPDGAVEIVYFGLRDEFVGRGLGKYLLTVAVERAWELGAKRVWLHTCTLDHPSALP